MEGQVGLGVVRDVWRGINMAGFEYWRECVSEAFDDVGIVATGDQIERVASWVEGAHENYGMATGDHVASLNLQGSKESEIKKLEKELEVERAKKGCPDCNGRGFIRIQGPYHGSDSSCRTCHGEGKV